MVSEALHLGNKGWGLPCPASPPARIAIFLPRHLQRFWGASGHFWQTQWEVLLSAFEGKEWMLYLLGKRAPDIVLLSVPSPAPSTSRVLATITREKLNLGPEGKRWGSDECLAQN